MSKKNKKEIEKELITEPSPLTVADIAVEETVVEAPKILTEPAPIGDFKTKAEARKIANKTGKKALLMEDGSWHVK